MTLGDLRNQTSHFPANTEIHLVSPSGECKPAALISKSDLVEDDPALETFPENAVVLDLEADND